MLAVCSWIVTNIVLVLDCVRLSVCDWDMITLSVHNHVLIAVVRILLLTNTESNDFTNAGRKN